MAAAADRSGQQQALTLYVKDLARQAGFDVCRITAPDAIPQAADDLSRYIAAGYHGTMEIRAPDWRNPKPARFPSMPAIAITTTSSRASSRISARALQPARKVRSRCSSIRHR